MVQAEQLLVAANADIGAARALFFPTISLTGFLGGISGDLSSFLGGDGAVWSLGAGLVQPIFNGGRIRRNYEAAKARYDAALQRRIDTERTVVQETRSRYIAAGTDVQRVKARAQSIRSAQSALDATRAGYEAGTRNIVDVLQAQRTFFAAQRDYANARYDYVILDLAAGVDEPVRLLAEIAGTLLVVTTDEPTALTDAYAFMKLTAAPVRHADCRILINLAASHEDGERTYQKLRKTAANFLKFDPQLAGVVRRDDRVRDSVRHQMSHLARHPTSESAHDVETVARGVIGAA